MAMVQDSQGKWWKRPQVTEYPPLRAVQEASAHVFACMGDSEGWRLVTYNK